MQVRPLVIALALVAGAAAFAAPTGPATTQRLQITATNHQVIDLTAAGGPEQVSHLVTTTFVTLTATDSAGGRAVRMVVDSARLDSADSPAPVDRAQYDSIRGVIATGWVAANGRIQDVVGQGDRGPSVAALLRALFPRVAPRAKVGDQWTDTTDSQGESEGLPSGVTTKRITNWSVSGEETVGGTRARKVESAYSQVVTGTVESGQGPIGFDGTGNGRATYLLASDGRQVGITSTMTLNVSLSVASVPEPVPLTLKADVVATPIR